MKGGGASKRKGSAFEREVCAKLSLWLTNGKRTDCLWRSAMSGGRSTVARAGGKSVRQCGDITAVSEEGNSFSNNFYIECKHLKNIGFDGLIKGGGALLHIWKDTVEQAKHYRRIPLLIVKQNRWPIIACTDSEGVFALQMVKPQNAAFERATRAGTPTCPICAPTPSGNIYISILEKVLENCKPNAWVKGWERDFHRARVRKDRS